MNVVEMTTKRFERLERTQRETNLRLGRIEDSLTRVVEVLEAHSTHFVRVEDALIGIAERVDRLVTAIARGRTQDLARFDAHDRRLGALERPRRRRPR
jgi:hypothetical protein